MKAVLKTSKSNYNSTKRVLPIIGEVEFNEEGTIEVELLNEGQLNSLLTAVPHLTVSGTTHVLTEDDIKNNPELTEAGLKAGEEVILPPIEEHNESINQQTDSNDLGKAEDEKNDIGGGTDANLLVGDKEEIKGTVEETNVPVGEGEQIKNEDQKGSDELEPIVDKSASKNTANKSAGKNKETVKA